MRKDLILIGDYLIKIAFVAGIIYLFYDIFSIFFPVIIAILISFLLQPPVKKLRSVKLFGKKVPESVAIVLVMLVAILVCVLVVVFMLRPLVIELTKLMSVMPQAIASMQQMGVNWIEQLEVMAIPDSFRSIIEQALSTLSSYVLGFMQGMLATTFSLASNVLGIIVLPFLVYYFLKDGSKFTASALRLLPPMWRPQARAILRESAQTLSAYVQGVITVGFIGGCVVGVGTYLIGLEYPYVFALLSFVAETVPFIGAMLAVIPPLLIALFHSTEMFIVVAIFYLLYNTFDAYILAPTVQGQYMNIHPVIVIISILIGGKIAGILGMLFAVPAFALIRILLKHIVTYPTKEKVEEKLNE